MAIDESSLKADVLARTNTAFSAAVSSVYPIIVAAAGVAA
jgi:hypothetical protein